MRIIINFECVIIQVNQPINFEFSSNIEMYILINVSLSCCALDF